MKRLFLFIIFTFFFVTENLSAQQTEKIELPGIPGNLSWINNPVKYHITETGIVIEAGAKTDKYIAANGSYSIDNAPQLVFTADSNFILSARIKHSFTNQWDAGALVLICDNVNYVKYCFEKDYKGKRRVVSVVTNNTSDDCNSMETDSDMIYYQIAKQGKVVFLYCSNDGKDWYLVRSMEIKEAGKTKVGFLSQSPVGENNTVEFSDIKYKAGIMKDFWKGE